MENGIALLFREFVPPVLLDARLGLLGCQAALYVGVKAVQHIIEGSPFVVLLNLLLSATLRERESRRTSVPGDATFG